MEFGILTVESLFILLGGSHILMLNTLKEKWQDKVLKPSMNTG